MTKAASRQRAIMRQGKIVDMISRPMKREIIREKNRFIDQQAIRIAMTRRVNDVDFDLHKVKMESIFIKYYSRVIRSFEIEISKMILKKHYVTMEKKATFWEFMLSQWITERGGEEARQTASTTRADIQRALEQALGTESAVTETQLIKSILKVKGFSPWRAETIARTEMHKGAMYASEQTAKKIGAENGLNLLKKWNPVQSERTRISHAAMAGSKPIPMDAYFIVGGERMRRPSDPNGSAGNVIHCRCVLTYETGE